MPRSRNIDRETEIMEFLEDGHSYAEAQEKYSTSPSQITRIKKRWEIDKGSTTTTTTKNTTTTTKDKDQNLELDKGGTTTTTTKNTTTTTIDIIPENEGSKEIPYEGLRALFLIAHGNLPENMRRLKKPQLQILVKKEISDPKGFARFLRRVTEFLEMI